VVAAPFSTQSASTFTGPLTPVHHAPPPVARSCWPSVRNRSWQMSTAMRQFHDDDRHDELVISVFWSDISLKSNIIFFKRKFGNKFSFFHWMKLLNCYKISRWYRSFLDESTHIWMNKWTFIYNLDVSSTHMDEDGSYTLVKIAFYTT
jgi:hypothetical protein